MFAVAGFSAFAGLVWYVIAANPALASSEQQHRASASLPQGQVLKRLVSEPAVLLVLAMSVGVFLFNHMASTTGCPNCSPTVE